MENHSSGLRGVIHAGRSQLAGFVAPKPKPPSDKAAVEDADAKSAPGLRSLSPVYDPDDHSGYVDILEVELRREGDGAPLNVALTGHYGSGKSSVLLETQARLTRDDVHVINLSLPSLGVGDGRIPRDGDASIDKTNLIQKEIVKQLLYRRKPSAAPASRYNRLDVLDRGSARRSSLTLAGYASLLALLVGVPGKLHDSIPAQAWRWIDTHSVDHISTIIQWLSLAVVFGAVYGTSMWLHRILQQRLRITELGGGAGPATVKLSESSTSFFDEYLDEIVYFFQTSGTNVVIFEDLDRFKDPHIFETLRELNLLLNNAEQTGSTSIKFVYAIRDSIFEQLDQTAGTDTDNPQAEPDEETRRESRRLITTNRTKFFDLVIPIVPFISHRTSRDLMTAELASVPDDHRPGVGVVDAVSAHITDMRLIKNICNEYDIFRVRILRKEGLRELTPDKLFASIVYKNLFLHDYENVRNGTSLLDDMYEAYRNWVGHRVVVASRTEKAKRLELRRLDAIATRSERLGRRLQTVMVARSPNSPTERQITPSIGGKTYSWDEVAKLDFWKALVTGSTQLTVTYPHYYDSGNFTVEQVETLLGESLDVESWKRNDRQALRNAIREAAESQRWARHATMAEAVQVEETFPYEGESVTLADVADRLFDGAPVVPDLIWKGFIDENFTLYVTQFPGDSSASAMNFIIRCVQPNVMDVNYHFGDGEDSDHSDIQAALSTERVRILNGQSIFNIELFDYLLEREPDELRDPIRRLAASADDDREFIDAYVGSGSHVATFIGLLSGRWAGIFDYLLGQEPEAADAALVSAALASVDTSVNYDLNHEHRTFLASVLGELPIVQQTVPTEQAVAIATVLAAHSVAAPEIGKVQQPLRRELIARSNYTITLGNLQTIIGPDRSISLDTFKESGPAGVYENLLANLSSYLDVVRDSQDAYAVADNGHFGAVLTDAHGSDPSVTKAVADLAHTSCLIAAHDSVEPAIWRPLVEAGRFVLWAGNLNAYTAEYGFDATLGSRLGAANLLAAGDADDRKTLALSILGAINLADEVKLRLVKELELAPSAIDAASVPSGAHPLIPQLVRAELVPDDASAYAVLGDDWNTKHALICVSRTFKAYMLETQLEVNDLHIISWAMTPDDVKAAVIDNLDVLSPMIGPKGASQYLRWASTQGLVVAPKWIEFLVMKSDSPNPAAAIRLLKHHAASMDVDTLRRILDALGGGFAQITSVGRDRPTVPDLDGMEAVLNRFRSEGIVSRFHHDGKRSRYRVSKHHS